jgi:hypothetical protein
LYNVAPQIFSISRKTRANLGCLGSPFATGTRGDTRPDSGIFGRDEKAGRGEIVTAACQQTHDVRGELVHKRQLEIHLRKDHRGEDVYFDFRRLKWVEVRG